MTAALQAQYLNTEPNRHEYRRAIRLDLDKVDLTQLIAQARLDRPELEHEDLDRLIRDNFRFIFFNKLNRSNFLVTPPPKLVVRKIEEVFRLRSEMSELLAKGRSMLRADSPQRGRIDVIRGIGGNAKSIKKIFSEYFQESSDRPFLLHYDGKARDDGNFARYLLQCEKISRLLRREVDRYFFNMEPAVWDASAPQPHSVEILSRSLHQLSQLTVRKIGEK